MRAQRGRCSGRGIVAKRPERDDATTHARKVKHAHRDRAAARSIGRTTQSALRAQALPFAAGGVEVG